MKELYCDALKGAKKHLFVFSQNDKMPYVGDFNTRRRTNIMHHLVCFLPGLLALGAEENICGTAERDWKIAHQIVYILTNYV